MRDLILSAMTGSFARLADFLSTVEPERIGSPERGDLLQRWELCRTDAFRVCVHRFLRSDPDYLHDHPKDWGSLILAGGYWEVTPDGRTWRAPGSWVQRKAEELHRVEIDPEVGDAWTLFITGPSRREWGFMTPDGWQDWRSYVAGPLTNRRSAMREDVAEAINEACATRLDEPVGIRVGRPVRVTNTKARRVFLRRLSLMLDQLPDDLTIADLRDEVGAGRMAEGQQDG